MTACRFALVGSGNISATYVRAVAALGADRAVVAAVVSRSGRRPEGVADTIPVYDCIEAVDVPVDAVILATPNGLHHEGAAAAAARGLHVLTEKCLDVTVEAMDRMIHDCDGAGVKLGVAFQRRMSPDNQVMKRVLADGVLGRVFAADLCVKFFRDQAYYDSAAYRGTRDLDGGGPFMQQAAHNIDVFAWFFGMPSRVASMLGTYAHSIESEDHGVALLRYADGMIGTVTASTCCIPGYDAALAIHGTRGSVRMENDEIVDWQVPGVANPSDAGRFAVHSGAGNALVADTAGHEAILTDFIAAIHEDRAPAVTGESARLATELVLQIYAADTPARLTYPRGRTMVSRNH